MRGKYVNHQWSFKLACVANFFLICGNGDKVTQNVDALKDFICNKFRADKKIYDGKEGREYQKLFAKLADELNGRILISNCFCQSISRIF